jgi:hypothetical protein
LLLNVISDVGCFFGPEGIIFGCIFYAKKSVENCHIYITSRVFSLERVAFERFGRWDLGPTYVSLSVWWLVGCLVKSFL